MPVSGQNFNLKPFYAIGGPTRYLECIAIEMKSVKQATVRTSLDVMGFSIDIKIASSIEELGASGKLFG